MADKEIQESKDLLEQAFLSFQKEHPELAEAMGVLNIQFRDYLMALSSIRGNGQSSSGNASSSF